MFIFCQQGKNKIKKIIYIIIIILLSLAWQKISWDVIWARASRGFSSKEVFERCSRVILQKHPLLVWQDVLKCISFSNI